MDYAAVFQKLNLMYHKATKNKCLSEKSIEQDLHQFTFFV